MHIKVASGEIASGTGTWVWVFDEIRVIPDAEGRDAILNVCGLSSISDFLLLTLERRKSVVREVMLSIDAKPRQLSRITGMNYQTIRNIAKTQW